MKSVLQQRPLRLLVLANAVSMIGSGMNSAAVVWHILQSTHSELSLGWLIVLQTVPAMLLMPFSGVIIDREDRRRLIMLLDAVRGLVILTVAVLAIQQRVQLWQLYAMNILVSAGFWMFWPTITALVQELTPEREFLQANTVIMTGVQGGWLIAGSLVGFMYNKVGLGGVLFIDFSTYLISIACYSAIRKGRYVVAHPKIAGDTDSGAIRRFVREMRDGLQHVRSSRSLQLLGATWACFIGAMMTQGVVTAPVSERILHSGAIGYGWLNAAWGTGAFFSALWVSRAVKKFGPHSLIAACMGALVVTTFSFPLSHWLAVACLCYFIGGISRATGGIALNAEIMSSVPKHLMGRVQNTFALAATSLQITLAPLVGSIAHRWSLTVAVIVIASTYLVAFIAASRVRVPSPQQVTYETAEAL